jgi:ribosomal protein S17E
MPEGAECSRLKEKILKNRIAGPKTHADSINRLLS